VSAPETSPPRHDFAVVSSDDIYTGKVLAVRRDQVRMPAGGTAVREIMEHAGAVAIAALDADDRLVMIYQYRHALGRRLWEMPAGLLDAAGEDPVETARRELAEEVGVAADDWSVLIDVAPSPGFSDESVRVYLATGLRDVGRPDLGADDEEADLEIHRIALADAVAMVFAGEIVNSSCVAGILAVQAVRSGTARTRPADVPWPDRPTRFAARKG
jgi:8-oxo-dGTP pyrophosphatase MutT (NUDIX family)